MADKKTPAKKPAPKAAPAAPKGDKRVDAIIKVLRENGLSLDHHPELK